MCSTHNTFNGPPFCVVAILEYVCEGTFTKNDGGRNIQEGYRGRDRRDNFCEGRRGGRTFARKHSRRVTGGEGMFGRERSQRATEQKTFARECSRGAAFRATIWFTGISTITCNSAGGEVHQFSCLPFNLSSALCVLTKVLQPVVVWLRQLGCRMITYINDTSQWQPQRRNLISRWSW